MKKLAVILILLAGCANPGIQAIDLARTQHNDINKDWSELGFQAALDQAAYRMEQATTPEERRAVLIKFGHQMKQIAWLLVQHERANTVQLLGRTYLKSDRPYIAVLIEEWTKAKERVENENPSP